MMVVLLLVQQQPFLKRKKTGVDAKSAQKKRPNVGVDLTQLLYTQTIPQITNYTSDI